MIDSPAANARRFVQAPLRLLNRLRPIGGPLLDLITARGWYRLQRSESFLKRSPSQRWVTVKGRLLNHRADESEPAWWASMNRFIRAYSLPGSHYLPQPLPVRVIYFSAEYNGQPWRRISSDLEIIELSGDHYAIVSDCTELANHLRVVLQES